MNTSLPLAASGTSMLVMLIINLLKYNGYALTDVDETQLATIVGAGVSFVTLAYGFIAHHITKKTLVQRNTVLAAQNDQLQGGTK